jgi:hypothetical protein
MPIKYDIDLLRSTLVGTSVNWLTILDVYKNSNNRTVCKCQCKCGSIKEYPIKVINAGKIKSCGCYHHSKEFSDSLKYYYKEHPDSLKERSTKYKEWCKNNKEFLLQKGKEHSNFYKENPDIVSEYRDRMSTINKTFNLQKKKTSRADSINIILNNNPSLIKYINTDDLNNLINGNLRSFDKIRTLCPICNNFSEHNVRDIFNFTDSTFKTFRLCKTCFQNMSTSKYEDYIAEFILTFYDGKLIQNDRSILNGKELDLYYPEKHIAIEFNGDYWHSELYKDKDYHYNKFKQCRDLGIILVSIFESEWNMHSQEIKEYLKDLFNGKENKLSFKESYMNNNFPSINYNIDDSYIQDSYLFKNIMVYTCGFSRLIS